VNVYYIMQELEIALQSNSRQMAALQRRQAADRKQSSKQQKKDWRERRQAFNEQLESRRAAGILGEHERSRLRQVESRTYRLTSRRDSCSTRVAVDIERIGPVVGFHQTSFVTCHRQNPTGTSCLCNVVILTPRSWVSRHLRPVYEDLVLGLETRF